MAIKVRGISLSVRKIEYKIMSFQVGIYATIYQYNILKVIIKKHFNILGDYLQIKIYSASYYTIFFIKPIRNWCIKNG